MPFATPPRIIAAARPAMSELRGDTAIDTCAATHHLLLTLRRWHSATTAAVYFTRR
jgi:hypothetical protein